MILTTISIEVVVLFAPMHLTTEPMQPRLRCRQPADLGDARRGPDLLAQFPPLKTLDALLTNLPAQRISRANGILSRCGFQLSWSRPDGDDAHHSTEMRILAHDWNFVIIKTKRNQTKLNNEAKRNQTKPIMGTPKDLYLEERRQQVLRRVQEAGRVSVTELSQVCGVSEVTIRNDLQALADRKLIVRTHGGAILAQAGLYELALASRRERQVEEKNRIGEAGAARVDNGDAIILDSSSTALAIAQRLKNHRHLTIVSNSLAVAQEMCDAPGVTVVLTGGRMRAETASLVGITELDMLQKFNIQKGFFGAHGITIEDGLTDVNVDEAETKRWLASVSRQVIAVLDATKWGKVGVVSFAAASQINVVISDLHAPAELVAEFGALNTEVILV